MAKSKRNLETKVEIVDRLRSSNAEVDKNIIHLSTENFENFSHSDKDGILIIMPSTKLDQSTNTARLLYRRAGVECKIIIVIDTLKQGFIKTVNDVVDRVECKYVVYLAQDAFPGRNWLAFAKKSLDDTNKGLLAFNDGKWSGRIASFGMVRLEWALSLYGKGIFYSGYHSHAADNELTVIARATGMFVYNPDCTLLEIDEKKDLGGSNELDNTLFKERFRHGFDGKVSQKELTQLSTEYKVATSYHESLLPQKLQFSKYLFNYPRYLSKPYSWAPHIPFAFYLVETLRPRVLLELGIGNGNAYFAFCQAVNDLKVGTKCYAIESREEKEANEESASEYERVVAINTEAYESFSVINRTALQRALEYHENDTIDILHIHNISEYNQVKNLFNRWLPKLSDRGVIIVDNINVKDSQHGTWRFYEDIKRSYNSMEFTHAQGLGVLCIGKNVDFKFLDFVDEAKQTPFIRFFFANLGKSVVNQQKADDYAGEMPMLKDGLKQGMLEIANRKREIERLNTTLERKSKEFEKFDNIIVKKDKELERLHNIITKKDKEQERWGIILEKKDSELEKRKITIEKYYEKINELKNVIPQKELMIAGLKESIKERISQIDVLKKTLSRQGENYKTAVEEKKNEIRELKNELKESTKTLDSLLHKKEKLSIELSSKVNQIKQLGDNIKQKDSRIEKLENEFINTERSLSETKGELRITSQNLARAEREIDSKNKRIVELDETLKIEINKSKSKSDRIDSLKTQIDDKRITLSMHREKIQELRLNVQSKKEKIGELRGVLEINRKDRREQRATIKHLERVNQKAKDSFKEKRLELSKQINDLEKELTAIKSSFSWRLTKPLRLIKRIIKWFRLALYWALHMAFALVTFNGKTLRKEVRNIKFKKVLKKSHLFDREWYLKTYVDVAQSGANPIMHYLRWGADEGRNPSTKFSTNAYLAYNDDVAHAQINPLVHYILFGQKEGRYAFEVEDIKTTIKKGQKQRVAEHKGLLGYSIDEGELLRRVRDYNAQKESRTAKVVCYTAIIGNYDSLIVPEAIVKEWDYVVFTDSIIEGEHIFEVRTPDFKDSNPTRVARYYKTHPHKYFGNYDYAIWIDSNILVKGNHLKNSVRECTESGTLLKLNPHPKHRNIVEELEGCIRFKKDDVGLMQQQVNTYISEGLPQDFGMYETNIIITRANDQRVQPFFEGWWNEIDKTSTRDQLSIGYALWKTSLPFDVFKGIADLRSNLVNDYCIFNHKANKRAALPYYNPPSSYTMKSSHEIQGPQTFDRSENGVATQKQDELLVKRIRIKMLEWGFEDRGYNDLQSISFDNSNVYKQSLAAWELALYHANKEEVGDCEKALEFLNMVNRELFDASFHKRFAIIEAECLCKLGEVDKAKQILSECKDVDDPNIILAQANLETLIASKLNYINRLYKENGFETIDLLPDEENIPFNRLISSSSKDIIEGPLVTVIMPAYNAENTIATALQSLQNQSYKNLEIIVVDDCSTDNTVEIVKNIGETDNRIKLLNTDSNGGPYIARNMALSQATGEFVTCMDSDDWAHCHRIGLQVEQLMSNQAVIGNVTKLVRVTNELNFFRRGNAGFYIQMNISSLMFRREIVTQKIGYWDSIRLGADMEFFSRLKAAFGHDSVQEISDIPLLFARSQEGTLTEDSIMGFSGYLMGVRREYFDSFNFYLSKKNTLKFKFPQTKRPFPIPRMLEAESKKDIVYEIILATDFQEDEEIISHVVKRFGPKTRKSINIGYIQMERYSVQTSRSKATKYALIEKYKLDSLVYGDVIKCKKLIIINQEVIQEKQKYLPQVMAHDITVILKSSNRESVNQNILKICEKNIADYFKGKLSWMLYDETIPKGDIELRKDVFSKLSLEPPKSSTSTVLTIAEKQVKWQKRIDDLRYRLLAGGFMEKAYVDLLELATNSKVSFLRQEASWELALWHANKYSQGDAEKCLTFLEIAAKDSINKTRNERLAIIKAECFDILGQRSEAIRVIEEAMQKGITANLLLARANVTESSKERISWINKLYELHGVSPISFVENPELPLIDRLTFLHTVAKDFEGISNPPLVTVIVPAYNAESNIQITLDALLNQTWKNLEILVSDDCSSDNTVDVVKAYMQKDSRIKLIASKTNQGPYVARNLALMEAKGEFVTCNDSDDWSHPEKIEKQVVHLIENKMIVANTSELARVTEDLKSFRRGNPGFYIQFNLSSLMFRREIVAEALGAWDSVRFGADGEFLQRLRLVFGKEKIVRLETGPMLFARQSETSLTGNSVFGYPGYFMGARKEYHENAHFYYKNSVNLRYDFPVKKRPFYAPEPMWPVRAIKTNKRRHFDVMIASEFRLTGGTTASNIEEIRAQRQNGLTTGLLQINRYNISSASGINEKVREEIDGESVEMIVYGEEVSCDLLIVRHPPILQHFQVNLPKVFPNEVLVIVNQPPFRDYGTEGARIYDFSVCQSNLIKYFGKKGIWFPIGPLVREAVLKEKDINKIINFSTENWYNLANVDEWKCDEPKCTGSRPIIGRHGRDQYVKWPDNANDLLNVYPDDPMFDVRILGGADTVNQLLGKIPDNWTVYPFDSIHPKQYLKELDFFVYFHHKDWVEAFGRTPLEAMAVGMPVILPEHFRVLFKDAAIYAKPSEVKDIVMHLFNNKKEYEERVSIGRMFAEENFGYSQHIKRIKPYVKKLK